MGVFQGKWSCSTNYSAPAPNPNPDRWELVQLIQYDHAYVLVVRYKDCTNFEGVKTMVFKGKYKHRDYLDPHFSEKEESPIARFIPTEEGLLMAVSLANSVGTKNFKSGE